MQPLLSFTCRPTLMILLLFYFTINVLKRCIKIIHFAPVCCCSILRNWKNWTDHMYSCFVHRAIVKQKWCSFSFAVCFRQINRVNCQIILFSNNELLTLFLILQAVFLFKLGWSLQLIQVDRSQFKIRSKQNAVDVFQYFVEVKETTNFVLIRCWRSRSRDVHGMCKKIGNLLVT